MCSSLSLKADIPSFDVITISCNNETFYLLDESQGKLKPNDLNYYNYKGEISERVQDVVERQLSYSAIRVYRQLDVIDANQLFHPEADIKKLYILRKDTILETTFLRDNYQIIKAENGNTYGYNWTAELNELDNYWLQDYPIESLFHIEDGMCNMTFYGIKDNLTPKEITALKVSVKTAMKEEGFKELLSELYKRHIIMLGFCSC